MKKRNHLLSAAGLLASFILLGAGCASEPTAKQSTNADEKTQVVVTNPLDVQSKCAAQAEKSLSAYEKTNAGLDFNEYSQQNHYNNEFNKCFVLISYFQTVPNGAVKEDILLDAYENNSLANCSRLATSSPLKITRTCRIGSDFVKDQEYFDFVQKRMELNDWNR